MVKFALACMAAKKNNILPKPLDAFFYRILAKSVSPVHAPGEGITQRCEYKEVRIAESHLRVCLPYWTKIHNSVHSKEFQEVNFTNSLHQEK